LSLFLLGFPAMGPEGVLLDRRSLAEEALQNSTGHNGIGEDGRDRTGPVRVSASRGKQHVSHGFHIDSIGVV